MQHEQLVMTSPPRQMRLTPDLVARVPAFDGAPGPLPQGLSRSTDADYEREVARILAGRPATGEVWAFAYGSLIWSPACEAVEDRVGTALGWHRSFCLGWNTVFRGSAKRPGLMLALDRGGSCKGIVLRLPPHAIEENLARLVRREMPFTPSPIPARWVAVRTAKGTLRAIAFPIDRTSGRYVGGLSLEAVADALAVAAGERGSMADYLCSTVAHLEERGIHDPRLWRLQDLVARRIESTTIAPTGEPR